MKNWTELAIISAVVVAVFGFVWKTGWLTRISGYLGETREELSKCNWPSRPELWQTIVLVFVVTAVLGLFTVGSDFLWIKVVRNLL